MQLCVIRNNMISNLYHMYCQVRVFDLIPVKKLNSILQPSMEGKNVKRMASIFPFFFFCGEQFLLKNDQAFVIKI